MAKFVESSQNEKIAGKYKVSATYAPIAVTCPDSCELKGEGCYAQLSFVGMINKKLERAQEGMGTTEAAKVEAAAIDAAFPKGVPQDGARGGRDCRIHVSGDCRTRRATRIVAASARRLVKRGAGAIWSYTHAWRNVPRSDWEGVSTLASIKTPEEVMEARAQGYAPAIVVPTHKSERKYRVGRHNFLPCPAQTRDMACVDCRLCFKADWLLENKLGIAFAAHGTGTTKIKKRLKVIS
jgi:hypothetical protein